NVEKDDAAAQTRKSDADEEVPASQQQLGDSSSSAFGERWALVGPARRGGGLQRLQRALAEIRKGSDDETMPGLQCVVAPLPAFGERWAVVGPIRREVGLETLRRWSAPSEARKSLDDEAMPSLQ